MSVLVLYIDLHHANKQHTGQENNNSISYHILFLFFYNSVANTIPTRNTVIIIIPGDNATTAVADAAVGVAA